MKRSNAWARSARKCLRHPEDSRLRISDKRIRCVICCKTVLRSAGRSFWYAHYDLLVQGADALQRRMYESLRILWTKQRNLIRWMLTEFWGILLCARADNLLSAEPFRMRWLQFSPTANDWLSACSEHPYAQKAQFYQAIFVRPANWFFYANRIYYIW